ncbi:hypothetical protein [Bacillus andreraoultii]|uniref:hypothetical protein n=1 Tax=Bacillus andreraoultii TaxID=1499685 RepID=UPI000539E889|nr:hypothetical protein [Bacillus andreraoultii]
MSNKQSTPLHTISPSLYRFVLSELENNFNIQPYDFQADGIKNEDGIQIIIMFGENFTHRMEQYFTNHSITKQNDDLKEFLTKVGEKCIQVLKDDYFKMMTP